jgi:hypothetical protein
VFEAHRIGLEGPDVPCVPDLHSQKLAVLSPVSANVEHAVDIQPRKEVPEVSRKGEIIQTPSRNYFAPRHSNCPYQELSQCLLHLSRNVFGQLRCPSSHGGVEDLQEHFSRRDMWSERHKSVVARRVAWGSPLARIRLGPLGSAPTACAVRSRRPAAILFIALSLRTVPGAVYSRTVQIRDMDRKRQSPRGMRPACDGSRRAVGVRGRA